MVIRKKEEIMEEKRAFELLDKKDPKGVSELLSRYYGKAAENFDTGALTALREQFFKRVESAFFTYPYGKDIDKVLSRIIAMVDGHPPPPTQFLGKILMLLDEGDKNISEDDRRSIALCLQRFVPSHPDFVDFYSIGMEGRLERLYAEDPDSEVRTILSKTLIAIRKKKTKDKEGSYDG